MRVATRDLRLGSGLTANRINQSNASGLYLAFDLGSCSPRPALCYRPLLTFPYFTLQCVRVISLEPRNAAPTGKTWERVKERVCFYAFYFYSQSKECASISLEINRVQPVHKPVPIFGASAHNDFVFALILRVFAHIQRLGHEFVARMRVDLLMWKCCHNPVAMRCCGNFKIPGCSAKPLTAALDSS